MVGAWSVAFVPALRAKFDQHKQSKLNPNDLSAQPGNREACSPLSSISRVNMSPLATALPMRLDPSVRCATWTRVLGSDPVWGSRIQNEAQANGTTRVGHT